MKILVVGSRGLVGRDLMRILIENGYKDIEECNSDNFIVYLENINNFDVIFNCATNTISSLIYKKINEDNLNLVYIDNSSYLRNNKSIPLVVPEINWINIESEKKIYANPNCVTIILTLFLNSIKDYKPKEIKVATYQSISGAGRNVLNEFIDDTKKILDDIDINSPYGNKLHNRLGFNFYPHESHKDGDGFNGEEGKMIMETKRILNMNIFPTCIRIPGLRCHGEVVNCKFENIYKLNDFIDLFKIYNIKYKESPECLDSEFDNNITVGHIRQNPYDPFEWSFFIVGDQLTRGASYNAFKIFKNINF